MTLQNGSMIWTEKYMNVYDLLWAVPLQEINVPV